MTQMPAAADAKPVLTRKWARILIVIIMLVLAVLATLDAVVGATRKDMPTTALLIYPNDAGANAVLASALIEKGQGKAELDAASAFAMRSLQSNGFQYKSLRTIGFISDLQKNPSKAASFMNASSKISRRDLPTNLWLIEDHVKKDDLLGALTYYDIALRTNVSSREVLFPTLLAATQYAEVRQALVKYFKANVGWTKDFSAYAASQTADVAPLASVVVAAGGLDDTDYGKKTESELLVRTAQTNPNLALAIFNQMPGHDDKVINQLGFTPRDVDQRFRPVTWSLDAENKLEVEFYEDDTANRRLSVFAPQNEKAPALSRLLFLKPGQYSLSARIGGVQFTDTAFVRWHISCAKPGAPENLRTDSIPSEAPGMDKNVSFAVPPSCPAQFLRLMVFSPHSEGLEFSIDKILIK